MIGIYGIRNLINNKIYVGQSIHIKTRWEQHRSALKHKNHENRHLQAAWNKYGKDNFVFEILEECLQQDLNERETYWKLKFDPNTYNLGNTGCIGTVSDETRKKISEGVKIRNQSMTPEERKQKFGRSEPRGPYSEERKYRISQSLKGKPSYLRSEECKRKSSENSARKHTIMQFTLEGKFIKEWTTIQEAADTLHIDQGNISATCTGRYNYYKGFRWKYKEDITDEMIKNGLPPLDLKKKPKEYNPSY